MEILLEHVINILLRLFLLTVFVLLESAIRMQTIYWSSHNLLFLKITAQHLFLWTSEKKIAKDKHYGKQFHSDLCIFFEILVLDWTPFFLRESYAM